MKMVSVIECVWRQALHTFARSHTVQSFEDHFARLKALADSVSANDVKLDRCLLEWTSNSNSSNHVRKPPVTYIEIYEDHAVTIGIFVLRSGMRIPLHDHPQMHGILKVLTGTLKLQSYNILPAVEQDTLRRRTAMGRNAIFVEKLPEVYVSDSDPACVLTPDEGNLHEIHSVDGPAAFLDILAPPYDSSVSENEERSCHYFQERKLNEDRTLRNKNIVALFRISSPSDFWSDSAPYTGPMLR
ncbi:hypothetical protein R5R35_003366 [Gryllus longicercus]|uniref:2-aminoethanethiol dioxygenase n=2 Tax=Gryllus longicercus TaxID=2509291 RepID=A0AAN9W5C1_9ORTH